MNGPIAEALNEEMNSPGLLTAAALRLGVDGKPACQNGRLRAGSWTFSPRLAGCDWDGFLMRLRKSWPKLNLRL